MTTTVNFKDIIDLPEWRPITLKINSTTTGIPFVSDLRNDVSCNPYIWTYASSTTFEKYHKANDEWIQITPATFFGVIGVGMVAIFTPSHGPNGTIGGTPTTTSFTLAALPNSATAGLNQLSNDGSGRGYKIRVYGNGAGGSGKTEERFITGNTSSTTPVITVDSAFSFTPQITDKYEIVSGRIYGAASGAANWKAYDIATETMSAALTTTNLASLATDSAYLMLDEQYVPYNRVAGEGMLVDASATYNGGLLKCLQATNSAAGTLTGQITSGDSGVLANEYSRFQIRIVEDTAIPTAVGQRRTITSHTALAGGPVGPVYTLNSNWTVTPSINCKYVIELNNDFLLWTGGNTVTYSYRAGGYAADANWSTAAAAGGAYQYPNPPASHQAGCAVCSCFSIQPDAGKNARHGDIIWWRGGATTTIAKLDVPANTFTTFTPGNNTSTTFGSGTMYAHNAFSQNGMYFYLNAGNGNRFLRFDLLNRCYEPWCYFKYSAGTATVGNKMAISCFIDGTTKVAFIYRNGSGTTDWWNCLLQR